MTHFEQLLYYKLKWETSSVCFGPPYGYWLIATSAIHRVLEYSIEYSNSKKLDSHSPKVEVYKIIHDMYDKSVALELPRNVSSTEGNKYKLQNHSFHYNFRKFSCAARVVTEPLRDMKKVICYNLFKQIVICLNKL